MDGVCWGERGKTWRVCAGGRGGRDAWWLRGSGSLGGWNRNRGSDFSSDCALIDRETFLSNGTIQFSRKHGFAVGFWAVSDITKFQGASAAKMDCRRGRRYNGESDDGCDVVTCGGGVMYLEEGLKGALNGGC